MTTTNPTKVYTDKILKLSRYEVEFVPDGNKQYTLYIEEESGKRVAKSNLKHIEEFYFILKVNTIYSVYTSGKNEQIVIFNSDDVLIGDKYIVKNHWLNGSNITVGYFDLGM